MNVGIVLSIYSMYKIYDSRKGLPPDTCPIENNNNLIIVTIIILISSLILSFIGDKIKEN